MICDMCHGKGWYENPKINHVSGVVAWERGYTKIGRRYKYTYSTYHERVKAIKVSSNEISKTNYENNQRRQASA